MSQPARSFTQRTFKADCESENITWAKLQRLKKLEFIIRKGSEFQRASNKGLKQVGQGYKNNQKAAVHLGTADTGVSVACK